MQGTTKGLPPEHGDVPGESTVDPVRAMITARTRAGSRMRQWALAIADACAERGSRSHATRTLEALTQSGALVAPASIQSTLRFLVKQGVLTRSGRRGAYRYHPRGFVEGEAERMAARNDAEIVADALHEATEAAGALVPSALVRLEMRRRGWHLRSRTRGAVDGCLRALVDARNVHAESVRGGRRRFFGPAARPELQVPAPAIVSASEAVLVLIRDLTAVLGRPASLQEVWVYARSLPAEQPARWFLMRSLEGSGATRAWEGGGKHLTHLVRNEKADRRARRQRAARRAPA
jgi:hypothetical protein